MENEHRIPKRSEVPVEDTWAIEDLYPTDDAWEEDLLRLQAAQSALAAYSGQLAVDGNMRFAYLQHSEQTNVLAERLAAYAMRQSAVATRSAHYLEMVG